MSRLLSSSRIEELDSITDAWELLQELERHPQVRVRAAYYSRLIVLAANQSSGFVPKTTRPHYTRPYGGQDSVSQGADEDLPVELCCVTRAGPSGDGGGLR
jgi:hypothetical protein